MYKYFMISAFILTVASAGFGDAVMRPNSPSYPGNLLYHKTSRVTVIIRGPVAETIIYSEFVNQWDQMTGAVYSFPVPQDANVTGLWHEYKNVYYKAVLKEVPQVTNPGTGEGGFAAELNQYLGKNSVSVKIDSIMPGAVQRIELRYIQRIPSCNGTFTYTCPLNMKSLYQYPVDLLEFCVQVHNVPRVSSFSSPSHASGWTASDSQGGYLTLRRVESKVYLQRNFVFTYSVTCQSVSSRVYGGFDTDKTGYFFTTILPPATLPPDSSFRKNVVFLIDKSNSMRGFKLQQSCLAVKAGIASMRTGDRFCVSIFDQTVDIPLHSQAVSPAAVTRANTVLDSVSSLSGLSASYLNTALNAVMGEFSDTSLNNEVLLFTDGFSACTPADINNTKNAGIFPVGLGPDVSRARLEAIAFAHNGFATFFNEDDAIASGIVPVFASISAPIIKSMSMAWEGAGVSEVLPSSNNFAFYQGLDYSISGKYTSSNVVTFGMQGRSVNGAASYFFDAKFPSDTLSAENMWAKQLWAAEKIKALERDIEVYSRQTELRPQVVNLSLTYGVKSKFTSYWAEHDAVNADIPPGALSASEGRAVFAFPTTGLSLSVKYVSGVLSVSFRAPQSSSVRFAVVRLFDAQGRLVAVLYQGNAGTWKTVFFNYKLLGRAGGVYFVQVTVGNLVETRSIVLR